LKSCVKRKTGCPIIFVILLPDFSLFEGIFQYTSIALPWDNSGMNKAVTLRAGFVFIGFLLACAASATTIARLSLDEITGRSELIISCEITGSFTAWDAGHKYIWTHYIVNVENAVKGSAGRFVEIAEPGGIAGSVGMSIGGATGYAKGEHVLIFLERMPNGYLRTAGLGQGKYGIDARGRLHGIVLKDVAVVNTGSPSGETVRGIDGMTLAEATAHIAARVRAAPKGVR
jgi:hypothetical protein